HDQWVQDRRNREDARANQGRQLRRHHRPARQPARRRRRAEERAVRDEGRAGVQEGRRDDAGRLLPRRPRQRMADSITIAPSRDRGEATVAPGGVRAPDALTRTTPAGEHTAILGPNGAGKSTLMKLLSLQLYPLPPANGISPVRVFGESRWNVFEL